MTLSIEMLCFLTRPNFKTPAIVKEQIRLQKLLDTGQRKMVKMATRESYMYLRNIYQNKDLLAKRIVREWTGWKAGVLQRGKLEKGTCLNGSMLRRKMRRRRELRRQKNRQ